MSKNAKPTRRDVVTGIGATLGGALGHPTNAMALTPQQSPPAGAPYRYAGKKWWMGEFDFPVRPDVPGQRAQGEDGGFESYQSMEFLRFAQDNQGQEPATSLPRDEDQHPESYPRLAQGGDPVLYLAEVMNRWAQDMTAWAKAVREDIKAIETHVGMPHGDPGDPPPVPWK